MASNDWERHKATILNLFLLENTPLNQVIVYMREKHNFVRNKSQYEYQLKKWSIKKKVPKEAWKYAAHQIKKRKGKDSEITLFGIPVSAEKARKEMQRYMGIPTANEFGKRLPSPEIPMGIVIRVKTPPIMDLGIPWPNTLPWFGFKNRVFPTLRDPNGLLREFFDATTQSTGITVRNNSLYMAWNNPTTLRQAVSRLTDTIPDDLVDRQRKVEALARNEFPPCLVTEMLRVIFFRLSNNMDNRLSPDDQPIHDRVLIRLVRAVSRSNPEMLSILFSGTCATTHTIKEAVYGSAIREKNYEFVERLLESGVDPNLPVKSSLSARKEFCRGIITVSWDLYFDNSTGMQQAANTLDTCLARILLHAGANIDNSTDYLLEIAATSAASRFGADHLDFMRLLIERGARVGPLVSEGRVSLFFALAISGRNCRLNEFLIENGAIVDLLKYSEASMSYCSTRLPWRSSEFDSLDIPFTPTQFALVLGNSETIDRLLQPLIARPIQALETIEKLLITACLVGDMPTVLKLVKFVDVNDELDCSPCQRITLLTASAWNPDTSIAEKLLELWAEVGPTSQDQLLQTSMICPIHVAAYYGNISLLQQLINRDADCKLHYVAKHPDHWWLVPSGLPSPLQLALESKNSDTITLFLSHLNLLHDDTTNDTPVSDIIPDEGLNMSYSINRGVSVGPVVAELSQLHISSRPTYSSRALFSAARIAIQSKNNTLFRLLARNRHTEKIDYWEASALVLSIAERQWSLVSLLLRDPFRASAASSIYLNINDLPWVQQPIQYIGATPLFAAFLSNDESLINFIIQRGFTPQGCDILPLIEGRIGEYEISSTIREAVWSKFPLHNMDSKCHEEILAHFISNRDVEKVREYIGLFQSLNFFFPPDPGEPKHTPISLAAERDNLELVRICLESGADPYYASSKLATVAGAWKAPGVWTTPGVWTALTAATSAGHLNIVEFLLDRVEVTNPSARLRSATKALMDATAKGYIGIMKLLIERGADVNGRLDSRYGLTTLERAADNGRLDGVQLLLEKGANIGGLMRIHYVRSIFFAMKSGYYAVANYLKQKGSWGEEDQRFYNRFYDRFRYRYVVDFRDFQRWYRKWFDCWNDDDWYSVGSSDDDSSVGEERASDDGFEGSEDVVSGHPEPIWHPQNGISCALTQPLNTDLVDEDATAYSLTACCRTPRVCGDTKEVDDTCENSLVVQQPAPPDRLEQSTEESAIGMSYTIASTSTADDRAAGQMHQLRQETVVSEQVPDLDRMDEDVAIGEAISPDFVDMEWEALISAGELNDMNDTAWEFPVQEAHDSDMLSIDPMDWQTMPPHSAEPEWEGPFTRIDEPGDENDVPWYFPLE